MKEAGHGQVGTPRGQEQCCAGWKERTEAVTVYDLFMRLLNIESTCDG